MILYIEDNETNLFIGKRTLCVLYDSLRGCQQKFLSKVYLIVCFKLLHFVSLLDDFCCIGQRCGQLLRLVYG